MFDFGCERFITPAVFVNLDEPITATSIGADTGSNSCQGVGDHTECPLYTVHRETKSGSDTNP